MDGVHNVISTMLGSSIHPAPGTWLRHAHSCNPAGRPGAVPGVMPLRSWLLYVECSSLQMAFNSSSNLYHCVPGYLRVVVDAAMTVATNELSCNQLSNKAIHQCPAQGFV
jgi:hypothetical protein